jgi:hypothetical protein
MNAVLKLMLKGSAISAVAVMMSAVGCSDSDKGTETGAGGESGGGKGGTPSAAGSTNNGGDSTGKGGEGGAGATTPGGADAGGADAGGADAGGADAGGADAGGADAGGAGSGGAAGVAIAKFCNGTGTENAALTYILKVGEGADQVTFTATTGECAPAVGVECKAIPVGEEVAVALFDAAAPTVELYSGTVFDIVDGDEVFFYTDLDQNNNDIVDAFTFEDATPSCKEATYEQVYE